jgi:tetratricopeptide (TPR) repeat protein
MGTTQSAYASLPEQAARLYRALGVGPLEWVDLDLACALLVCPRAQARRALDELATSSLLYPVPEAAGRFRFDAAARDHAAACAQGPLERADAADCLRRLFAFLVHAASAAEAIVTPSHRVLSRACFGPAPAHAPFPADETLALDWLAAQQPNYMAVMRFCAERGEHQVVAHLADALWPLWQRRRHPAQRLEAQFLGLAAARAARDEQAVGTLLTSLAGTLITAGLAQEALGYLTEAAELYEHAGERRGQGQALNGLAKANLQLGRLEPAREQFTRAYELRSAAGYPRGAALSQQGLGLVALAAGDAAAAQVHLRRSHQGLCTVGDRYDAAWSQIALARALHTQGRHADALREAESALGEMSEAGSRFGAAGACEALGDLHAAEGQRDAAFENYGRALEHLAGGVDPLAEARVRALFDTI